VNRRKPRVGDVIQLRLPSSCYAYGRILRDASIAFYSETTTEPGYRQLVVVTINSS